MNTIDIVLSIVIAYLFGSIPTAVWVSKWGHGMDIRDHGSKNAGMTNVFRVLGFKSTIPVIIVDLSKGFFAPYVATQLVPEAHSWLPLVAGIAAIVGHSFTCMAGFRGGKGVLTALGVFLFLALPEAIIAFVVWAAFVKVTRYVSLASIAACLALGISLTVHHLVWPTVSTQSVLIAGWIVAVFVIVKHKSNIVRLMNGTENRFGKKNED